MTGMEDTKLTKCATSKLDPLELNVIIYIFSEGVFVMVNTNYNHLIVFGCHDPSFGLTTKARAWKGAGRKCNLGITFTFT